MVPLARCRPNRLGDPLDVDVVSPAAAAKYIHVRVEPCNLAMLSGQFDGIAFFQMT